MNYKITYLVYSRILLELFSFSPSVAKSMFSASTPALLNLLSRVLLPALVYPTRATTGKPSRILNHGKLQKKLDEVNVIKGGVKLKYIDHGCLFGLQQVISTMNKSAF